MFNVDGLILDFRSNAGGYVEAATHGLGHLFDEQVPDLWHVRRSDALDYFLYEEHIRYRFVDQYDGYFDKPIAVLTGPGAFSAADVISYRMKSHPKAMFFGKPTSGAFGTGPFIRNIEGWMFRIAEGAIASGESSFNILTHTEIEIDEPIWLDQLDVRRGKDTVVEAALAWIDAWITSEVAITDHIPLEFDLMQNFPNPFNASTQIDFSLQGQAHVTLKIFNIKGQEIRELVNDTMFAGRHTAQWDGRDDFGHDVASGIYLYQLRAGLNIVSMKLALLR